MSVVLLKEYQLGDMKAQYYCDEQSQNVELMIIPAALEPNAWEQKKQVADSLVQVKLIGDTYPGSFAGGGTLRQSETVGRLRFKTQQVEKDQAAMHITTVLEDMRGYTVKHHLIWKFGQVTLRSYTEFCNATQERVKLELLSSFSLGGISPFLSGAGHGLIDIHRIRSVWSMEGRLETRSLEELQLEPSWEGHAVRCERFGQVGSLAVNHYFPYLVVEDKKTGVFWGAQLAHNASWQMELYRRDDGLAVSGGLADREFGHWVKTVEPGETFISPEAILTTCHGGTVDDVSQRLTSAVAEQVNAGPQKEQELPVIFNEYCTTWGCPSHKNITEILGSIKDRGFDYFVIDCGWYKEEGVSWNISMGDYQVSGDLFPAGLGKTVEAIKAAGLVPGIWFEIDTVGRAAKAYQLEEHLLKRDGVTLTTSMRRFWNMADPWVENYLSERVIRTLKDYGFEYMKMDYNDTIGLGCDDPDSLGEGLRKNMAASYRFIEKVKYEIPGIILENCASGGHKQEPLMMELTSMSSFSDAHECEEIPIIAANMHRVILPRQSQIWAVIRKEDSLKRIAYSVANTFLGRMCISGDVTDLSEQQWQVLDQGIAFYKSIAPIIKDGYTRWYGPEVQSYRHPTGWQGILRIGMEDQAFAVIHTFNGELPDCIEMVWEDSQEYMIEETYSHSQNTVEIINGTLSYRPAENMSAVAVRLKKVRK